MRDPRVYQIAVLGSLFLYGEWRLDFGVPAHRVLGILLVALLSQALATRIWRLPGFDPKSALISGLSLCLLLRTTDLGLALLAAAAAIASKFLLRFRGKHLFNPTNFGLVALIAATNRVWVSPGQWGSAAFFAFLIACAGGLVVNRAARSDVTIAFVLSYASLLFARSLHLSEPLSIPLHRLQSGALLIFAFFMISDPKTTPDSRAARILFALLVAAGAWFVQFRLFRTNGLLWSLAACSLATPILDRLLPGERHRWKPAFPSEKRKELPMKRAALAAASVLSLFLLPRSSSAFCGFYVAKADTKLFNKASQVVLVRDDNRTVLTMSNDYRGELKEFAVVIPVPTFLEKGQIHVGEKALIDHLDAYSSPRLVEYFDGDPCRVLYAMEKNAGAAAPQSVDASARARSLGVAIEASYTVGEYDILILSAKQSSGLETWLKENGYRIPRGASRVLDGYLKQGMHFFVARVNLSEQAKLGFSYLRPLQIAYESPKFMLPIRLGMVNADGAQELFLYTLTRKGRVETTNYRTVKLPTGMDLPLYLKDSFKDFYRDMFAQQVRKEDGRSVFLEYAWDMGWCDPCAADPLTAEELSRLGVFWKNDASQAAAAPVFLTRLHLRYDAEHFPEDLVFQETGDRENFQARYVLRHEWEGDESCPAAEQYRKDLRQRRAREAEELASLTGWDVRTIRHRMNLASLTTPAGGHKWWEELWKPK
jgi:hypothetical protein